MQHGRCDSENVRLILSSLTHDSCKIYAWIGVPQEQGIITHTIIAYINYRKSEDKTAITTR